MGRQGTSTDPIIEHVKNEKRAFVGWMTFLGSLAVAALIAIIANQLDTDNHLLGLIIPMCIAMAGVTVGAYLISRPEYTYCSYSRTFITLVDVVDDEHFMECWRLNNRFAYPMLKRIIKQQLVQAALVVLKLDGDGKRSEAEQARNAQFKPLHKASLAFGLVEEKWDSYFLVAEAILLAEQTVA